MKLQSVKDIKDLKDKRVLVRADFDVPTKSKVKSLKSKVVEVEDDYRIRAAVPTIKYLLDKEAIVILIAHLGRPKGRKDKDLSLQPVAEHLQKLLRRKVIFLPYGDFSKHENQVTKKGRVKIFVLENLRFWKGEESNSKSFAKELSSLADYYVNDAFAVCHRKHVSVSAINQYLPGYAGLSLEQEIGHLSQIMKKPRRPLLGVMGGVKISTKLPVMENLLKKVDLLVVGGALANNFIKACGWEIGRSVIEKKYIEEARELMSNKKSGEKVIIPVDVKVGTSLESRKAIWRSVDEVKKNEYILDIGPRTRRLYTQLVRHAGSVIWNGPLGLFENKHFKAGTQAIVRACAKARGVDIIIGGGDTLSAVGRQRLSRKRNVFLSAGGGAMLAFLAGDELPGLEPLIKKQ